MNIKATLLSTSDDSNRTELLFVITTSSESLSILLNIYDTNLRNMLA